MSAPGAASPQLSAARQHLWRGAMYELLALAFSYPGEDAAADLEACIEALAADEAGTNESMRSLLTAMSGALGAASVTGLAAAHNLLFTGEVPCSPYETEYEFDAFAKARQLADIAGFYRAFGLKVATRLPGPADFIATELEFMASVVMREAYAAARGWEERRQTCREAQRAFIEDHLGRWGPLFCRTLPGLEETAPLYAAAAALCGAFLAGEIEALGARPRPATPRGSAATEAESFTCMFAAPADDKEEQP